MFVRLQGIRRATAVALGALLLMQTTGCSTWRPVTAPTPTELQKNPDAKYLVTTTTERVIELTSIHYRNDSILGISPESPGAPETGVPMSEVATVRKQAFSPVTTVIAGLTLAAVLGLASGGGGSGRSASFNFGSCPLIYSWDGSTWHLDSGTFGGAITPALTRTDLDNLLFARADGGLLRFRMTDEANESEHVDAFTVVAVDHPVGTDVAPDARANNTFHVIRALRAPTAARDFMGRDVLAAVQSPDARSWESIAENRDPQDPVHLRDGLELTFRRPDASDQLQLVVDAQNTEFAAAMMGEMVSAFGSLTAKWYDPATTTAASAPMARAQHAEGFLQVAIWDGTSWRPSGEIWEAGPEVAKRQVLPIDLTGISGGTIRVRLESAPSFWQIDYVGLGPVVNAKVVARDLPTVSVTAPRDADALAHLQEKDGRFLDMERGDTISLAVRDTAGPPAAGMTRAYLARTSGWYRIHGRDDQAPDIATLTALGEGPHGAAKLAVTRMNQLLSAAKAGATRASPR